MNENTSNPGGAYVALSWGEVRDLRIARETLRRLDPPTAFHLDALFPVPPCPHKVRQERTQYGERPRWSCAGCGVRMRGGGHGGWYAVPTDSDDSDPS